MKKAKFITSLSIIFIICLSISVKAEVSISWHFLYHEDFKKNQVVKYDLLSVANSPDYFDEDNVYYQMDRFSLMENLLLNENSKSLEIRLFTSLAEEFSHKPWNLMDSNTTWGIFYYNDDILTDSASDFILFDHLDFILSDIGSILENNGFFVPLNYTKTTNYTIGTISFTKELSGSFFYDYLGFHPFFSYSRFYNESIVINNVNTSHTSEITVEKFLYYPNDQEDSITTIHFSNNGTVIIPINETFWEEIRYNYEVFYGLNNGLLYEFSAQQTHKRKRDVGIAASSIGFSLVFRNMINRNLYLWIGLPLGFSFLSSLIILIRKKVGKK